MEKYKSEEMLSSWFGEGLSYFCCPRSSCEGKQREGAGDGGCSLDVYLYNDASMLPSQ